MNEILITPDGLEKLNAELERLHDEWAELVDRVRRSLEHGGGFAENGEFLHALQEQELLERRITLLERRLQAARLVQPERDGELDVGERVRVRDLATDELLDYRVVGTGEGDPVRGDISHASPVGAALLGKRTGEIVEVDVPSGRLRLQIVDVDG